MHRQRLYVFDMDGTLLPHTTGLLELAKITGHCEILKHLERQYTEREIDCSTFTAQIAILWQHLPPDAIKQSFVNAPKMHNIHAVIQKIADQGDVSCMITSSQDFFAHQFYEYGFDHIFASKEFHYEPPKLQRLSLKQSRYIHSHDKLRIAQELCEKLNLQFNDTVAFGDSLSDIHLFQHLSHTISVNGDYHISQLAAHHYQGFDLLEAFHRLK